MRFLFIILVFSASLLSAQEKLIVSEIRFSGNEKTKDFILLREFPVKKGDEVLVSDTAQLFKQIHINLVNTNLFNFIEVNGQTKANELIIEVSVQERWYLWPRPIFGIEERNVVSWWNNGHDLTRANYGATLSHRNFRGRKELLQLSVQLGYVQTLGFLYDVPFLNQTGRWGLITSYYYRTRHEFPLTTNNNRWDFYEIEEELLTQEQEGLLEVYFRPKNIYQKHRFQLGYRNMEINDSVRILYPRFLDNGTNNQSFFQLGYEFRVDRRNDKDFPTEGHYLELGAVRRGLGVLDQSVNTTFVLAEWKQFMKWRERLFVSYNLRLRIADQNDLSYYTEGILNRRDIPRGYDAYVLNGPSFGVARFNTLYQFIQLEKYQLPVLKDQKFSKIHLDAYLSWFVDAGYALDHTNYKNSALNERMLYSTGLGLNLVTYYDLVFRLEYSVNHLIESGIFIHFTAPI